MTIDRSRRNFLLGAGVCGGLTLAHPFLPMRFAYANTPNDKKLLVIILRGAMDGLAAVVPYKDKYYHDARGGIALPENDKTLIDLDGFFALHTALKPFADLWQQKQLVIYHASATPYRSRSHFDAQDLLENGTDTPHGLSSGWLNRAIGHIESQPDAIAIGASIPLALRGRTGVGSWAPSVLPGVDDDFLSRVQNMYIQDPLLFNSLNKAIEMEGMGDAMQNSKKNNKSFLSMIKKAAQFMTAKNAANIATIELGGWDTHANQGLTNGRLANNFRNLSQGIEQFKKDMGKEWENTAVVTITEFGRTVKGNGTAGTDHGTASVSFLMGGSVKGGKILGDWPSLKKLYEGRDLMPANDLRALLKTTLNQHLEIPKTTMDTIVFPQSKRVWLKDKLFT